MLLIFSAMALACSLLPQPEHTLDPEADVAGDPAAPVVEEVVVTRGKGPERSGCGLQSTSCDDLGFVVLVVDDVDVGYRLEVVDGESPVTPWADAIRPFEDGRIALVWVDGADRRQEPIAFTLSITSVDPAGNESDPVEVLVEDPGR